MITNKIKFALLLVLLLGVAWVIKNIPLNQGLDLQGGMRMLIQAQEMEGKNFKDANDAMLGVLAVIRNRIDGLGVSEPLIARKGRDQIVVELPGIKDPQRAVRLIGETALMEFVEAEWLPGNASNISTEDLKILGGDNARIAVYTEKDMYGKIKRETPIILKRTALNGNDLKRANPTNDNFGKQIVAIEFTSEGAKKFADVTRANVGKPLAILLDGTIISAPNISGPIYGGKAVITGQFSLQEVKDLVIKLNAGKLPVPVKIIEKKEVGPTLGKESIIKSIKAGLLGFVLVSIIMLIIYKYFGLVAIIALMIYTSLNLAVLSILHVTLTLPGIAGIVLSIGIAVDANVLIFERYKEELRHGRTVLNSLEIGFKRAMVTIFDSNITTLLTAVVLFWLGTGSIRGFAVTLITGIVISMFTALYLTRLLLTMSLSAKKIRESKLVQF